jgi:hypothetical protein
MGLSSSSSHASSACLINDASSKIVRSTVSAGELKMSSSSEPKVYLSRHQNCTVHANAAMRLVLQSAWLGVATSPPTVHGPPARTARLAGIVRVRGRCAPREPRVPSTLARLLSRVGGRGGPAPRPIRSEGVRSCARSLSLVLPVRPACLRVHLPSPTHGWFLVAIRP